MQSSLRVDLAREDGQFALVTLHVRFERLDFLQLGQNVHHERRLSRAYLALDHGDERTVLVWLYVVPFNPLDSLLDHFIEAYGPSIQGDRCASLDIHRVLVNLEENFGT